MYDSYHDLTDFGAYELEELYGFTRFADVKELYRSEVGVMLVDPDGTYRYRVVGYFTEISEEDGSCELTLVVKHKNLPLPTYENMLERFVL